MPLVWLALLALVIVGFNAPPALRWDIAGIVAVLGAYAIALNWAIVIRSCRYGEYSSRIPLVGGILCRSGDDDGSEK